MIMRKAILAVAAFAVLSGFSVGGYAATQAQPAQAATVVAPASVNLNAADAETLSRELRGIGETKAKAIIDYREEHGPFSSVDELLEVKGIGSATLDKIRGQLTVQ
jgi:competence protein ComEA